LKKVISVLEIDCMQTEEKLKEKQVKNETLHEELTSSKNQLFDFNLQIKKLTEENRSLNSIIEKYENERKTLLEKYSSIAEDVEKVILK
jgi:predicted RNase H-like nuclease (RuvC/YqgF family)